MRRLATAVVLGCLVLLGSATADDGAYPGAEPGDVVHLVDSKGVKIRATHFGKLFAMPRLTAFLGDSEIDIPFDRIRRLEIGQVRDNRLPVTVSLAGGNDLDVILDRTEYESIYGGKAEFGAFRIRLEDIREVEWTRPETRGEGAGQRCGKGHVFYNDLWRYCPYDGQELSPAERAPR